MLAKAFVSGTVWEHRECRVCRVYGVESRFLVCFSYLALPNSERKQTRCRNSARVRVSARPVGITEPSCFSSLIPSRRNRTSLACSTSLSTSSSRVSAITRMDLQQMFRVICRRIPWPLIEDTPFARPPRRLKTKIWSAGGVGEAPTSLYYGPSSDWILRRSPNLFRRAHKTLDAINNRRMRKAWVYKPSQ